MVGPQYFVTAEIPYHGMISNIQNIMSIMQQVWAHLIRLDTGNLTWTEVNKQWELSGNFPNMTEKGADIIGAVMTILHNGLIFAAQFSTLLPYNVVPVNIPT